MKGEWDGEKVIYSGQCITTRVINVKQVAHTRFSWRGRRKNVECRRYTPKRLKRIFIFFFLFLSVEPKRLQGGEWNNTSCVNLLWWAKVDPFALYPRLADAVVFVRWGSGGTTHYRAKQQLKLMKIYYNARVYRRLRLSNRTRRLDDRRGRLLICVKMTIRPEFYSPPSDSNTIIPAAAARPRLRFIRTPF